MVTLTRDLNLFTSRIPTRFTAVLLLHWYLAIARNVLAFRRLLLHLIRQPFQPVSERFPEFAGLH